MKERQLATQMAMKWVPPMVLHLVTQWALQSETPKGWQ
jgi:hypothetical protein